MRLIRLRRKVRLIRLRRKVRLIRLRRKVRLRPRIEDSESGAHLQEELEVSSGQRSPVDDGEGRELV